MSDILEDNDVTGEFISNIKNNPTKASFFVRNMLGYNLSFWDDITYLNTYVSLNPNYMYICFINDENPKQIYMLNTLSDNPNWINMYKNNNFIICKLLIPLNFNEDFIKIMNGQYSKTSEDYKDLILKLNCKLNRVSFDKIKNGLYVTKSAIKELEDKLGCNLYIKEVISRPSLEKELFNPSIFNIKYGEI